MGGGPFGAALSMTGQWWPAVTLFVNLCAARGVRWRRTGGVMHAPRAKCGDWWHPLPVARDCPLLLRPPAWPREGSRLWRRGSSLDQCGEGRTSLRVLLAGRLAACTLLRAVPRLTAADQVQRPPGDAACAWMTLHVGGRRLVLPPEQALHRAGCACWTLPPGHSFLDTPSKRLACAWRLFHSPRPTTCQHGRHDMACLI